MDAKGSASEPNQNEHQKGDLDEGEGIEREHRHGVSRNGGRNPCQHPPAPRVVLLGDATKPPDKAQEQPCKRGRTEYSRLEKDAEPLVVEYRCVWHCDVLIRGRNTSAEPFADERIRRELPVKCRTYGGKPSTPNR